MTPERDFRQEGREIQAALDQEKEIAGNRALSPSDEGGSSASGYSRGSRSGRDGKTANADLNLERYLDAYVSGNPAPKIYSKPQLQSPPGKLSDEHLEFFKMRGECSY